MEMETENTPKTSDKLLLLRKEYKKTTVKPEPTLCREAPKPQGSEGKREVFRFPVRLIMRKLNFLLAYQAIVFSFVLI